MSAELPARIDAFDIDGDVVPDLPFAARLARENGWTRPFAERAVREYKRFVTLAMTAGHPVTPSVQVDAVWHLHLTYTRSYWQRLCAETLGQPLHHDPTRGGAAEGAKFHDWYARTLESYRRLFGQEPPADLWPHPDTRFGDDQRFVTVNTARNWIVPKAPALRLASCAVLALVALLGATGCIGGAFDPFQLKGTDYFQFLIPAFAVTFLLGIGLRFIAKGPGFTQDADRPDARWDQIAYLNGGAAGLLSATLARLVQSGAARIAADKRHLECAGALPPEATDVERFVFKQLPIDNASAEHLTILRSQVNRLYRTEHEQLRDDGLTLGGWQRFRAGLGIVLPFLIVYAYFGVQRLVIGLVHGKPVGFLVLTLVLAGFLLFVLQALVPWRTRKGDQLLKHLKRERKALKSIRSTQDDAALAVALFGTAALATGELAALGTWYPRTTYGDSGGCGTTIMTSGGGGGCGGGGGGCGGGGCGGCGGG